MYRIAALALSLVAACASTPVSDATDAEAQAGACVWSQFVADGAQWHVCDAGARSFACETRGGATTWRYYVDGAETGRAVEMPSLSACVERSEAGAAAGY